jgi:HK97 gp10 family phage protein
VTIEIRIPEMDRIKRDIKRAGKKGAQDAAKVATRNMAVLFKKELIARAPERRGNLKRHIKHSVRKAKNFTGWLGKVGLLKKRNAKDYPFYAFFIERGASGHSIAPTNSDGALQFKGGTFAGAEHPGITAKPFVRPTFVTKRAAAVKLGSKIFVEHIRKIIK